MKRVDRATQKTPGFYWQGVLIVLPVVLMSVLGLRALQRDKAAVAEDARQQAEALAKELSQALGQSVAGQFAARDLFAVEWAQQQREFLTRGLPLTMTGFAAELAEWRTKNPGLAPESVLPNRLRFDAQGVLVEPRGYDNPPQPPAWFGQLTSRQHAAWDELQHAANSKQEPNAAAAAFNLFIKTDPPPAARTNAEFALLQAELRLATETRTLISLLGRINDYPDLEAESGVSQTSLFLAAWLRRLSRIEPTNALWVDLAPLSNRTDSQLRVQSVPGHVFLNLLDHPSVLNEQLFAEVQALARPGLIHSQETRAWLAAASAVAQSVWSAEERLRVIAESIRTDGKSSGLPSTNLWVNAAGDRWFCRVRPAEPAKPQPAAAGIGILSTNLGTEVRVYRRAMVAGAFVRAVRDLGVRVPAYLGVSITLADETLPLDLADIASETAAPAVIPTFRYGQLPAGRAPENHVSQTVVSAPTEWQSLFGNTSYEVQVRLTDPRRLFAQQRQRTLLFGSLIAASALVALLGLVTAYRSFRRQWRLNEMKSNFVSSVSHELRAPIASVRLMAESLERGRILEATRQREYFHFISQECRRLSALVENVLDFSRIEQGHKQYEFEPTDLVALARQTVQLLQPYAAERNVALELILPSLTGSPSEIYLTADGHALQQALVNLIDNALKHSPPGGKVIVGLQAGKLEEDPTTTALSPGAGHVRPQLVELWVEDQGEGIPPAEQERIFERFYRLGSELRRQTQGVGIGLSIVKHVVEAHGGRVRVRSAVSQGSRFTIELPAKPPATHHSG